MEQSQIVCGSVTNFIHLCLGIFVSTDSDRVHAASDKFHGLIPFTRLEKDHV